MPRRYDPFEALLSEAGKIAERIARDWLSQMQNEVRFAARQVRSTQRARLKGVRKKAAKTQPTPTLYSVLGVDRKAEPEIIEAAWKAAARKYHPDRNGSPHSVERMKIINAAHDVLADPAKRREYDRSLR